MNEKVRLSFQPAYEEDPSPNVVLYNPSIMPFALFSQVTRFGLIGDKHTRMAGNLKGNRKGLTEMIKSYGFEVEIVSALSQAT